MTDDNIKRGLTNKRNLGQEDFEDDYEVDVRSEKDGYLSERPASVTDLRRGLDASGVRSGDIAEVWVSPDGDDRNPGTRSAPFASIGEAVSFIQENRDEDVVKFVKVKPGTYNEGNILVNHQNVHIIGQSTNPFDQTVQVSTDGTYNWIFGATQMTKKSWQGYIKDGGPSYIEDGDDFTYTGAATANRNLRHEAVGLNGTVQNLRFFQDPNDTEYMPPVMLIAGHKSDDGGGLFDRYQLINCSIMQFSDSSQASLYLKNSSPQLFGVNIVGGGITADNVGQISLESAQVDRVSNYPTIIVRRGGQNTSLEGDALGGGLFSHNLQVVLPTEIFRLYSNNGRDIHALSKRCSIEGPEQIELIGDVDVDVARISCEKLVRDGDTDMTLTRLDCSGNADFIGNGTNSVSSGTIEGNLTVSGGASIDFTGVHVLGNVDLTGAGAVTWRGGSFYGTLTDPDDKLGAATAGDYLNVEAP